MNKIELYTLIFGKKYLSEEEINSSLKNPSKNQSLDWDDFDRDAIEGWKLSPNKKVNMLNVNKRLGLKNSKGLSFRILTFSALFIATIFVFLNLKNEPKEDAIHPEQTRESKNKMIEQTDTFIGERFDTLNEEKENDVKEIQSLIKQQKTTSIIAKTEMDNAPILQIDRIPLKPFDESFGSIPKEIRAKRTIKEVYFYNFKLVDYRAIRSNLKIETKQLLISGTPANWDSTNQIVSDENWKNIDIPYIDYIKKSMYYLEKGSLKRALDRFDIVLNHYPDDVNALFYSGFSFYNLNDFSGAVSMFSRLLQVPVSNFDEEATWYLGLAYEGANQQQKANQTFSTIAQSNSFYAKQAAKKIQR